MYVNNLIEFSISNCSSKLRLACSITSVLLFNIVTVTAVSQSWCISLPATQMICYKYVTHASMFMFVFFACCRPEPLPDASTTEAELATRYEAGKAVMAQITALRKAAKYKRTKTRSSLTSSLPLTYPIGLPDQQAARAWFMQAAALVSLTWVCTCIGVVGVRFLVAVTISYAKRTGAAASVECR